MEEFIALLKRLSKGAAELASLGYVDQANAIQEALSFVAYRARGRIQEAVD